MGDKALRGNKLTKFKKDFAAPWDKDAEVIPELKALEEGIKKVSKDQKKFKVLKSPGSWPTVTIKVPKKKK